MVEFPSETIAAAQARVRFNLNPDRFFDFGRLTDMIALEGRHECLPYGTEFLERVVPLAGFEQLGDRFFRKTVSNHLRGMPAYDCIGRHVFDGDGARGDHRAISDLLRRVENLGAVAEPDFVADLDPLSIELVARSKSITGRIEQAMRVHGVSRMVRILKDGGSIDRAVAPDPGLRSNLFGARAGLDSLVTVGSDNAIGCAGTEASPGVRPVFVAKPRAIRTGTDL
jgi:hypothetical protein